MMFRSKLTTVIFIVAAASAQAAPTISVSTFATGSTVSATTSQPDSITDGAGSVWVEYGNGADSTGLTGSSTIVRYSPSGAILATISVRGLVDGLKYNPVTGMVWALVNNDGNAELSIINPSTNTAGPALKYGPPYIYGANSLRGYDDVAFLGGKVYLSYTNPLNPADPVLQTLDQGNMPSGSLTTTTILTAKGTNSAFTSSSLAPPDIDSLKSTPSGQLVLTSEGDVPAVPSNVGSFSLISNPGTAGQTVSNVIVTKGGVTVTGMDDVLFPGATAGTLYVSDTKTNTVYAITLSGLSPNTPIVSLGSFNEVALVNFTGTSGIVGTELLGSLPSPHGLDFVASNSSAPEPSTWPMLLLGLGGLAAAAASRRKSGAAAGLASAS